MTVSEESEDAATRLGPGGWIGIGLLIALVGGFITAGTGDSGWLVIAAVPGSVMVSIGVIAKGVQVGLREVRRG